MSIDWFGVKSNFGLTNSGCVSISKMLKEGKEASEAKASQGGSQDGRRAVPVDVFTKFEEHQGMAHLEALEILSHESEAKVSH